METGPAAAQAQAREELSRRLAAQLEGLLAGEDAALAGCFVAALAPADAQEQALAMQMALTHQVAVAQLAKAGQPDLPERPQQITLGIAARFLTLNHRQSAAFDRHRTCKARMAERAQQAEARKAKQAAAAAEQESPGEFLVLNDDPTEEAWTLRVSAHQRALAAGILTSDEQRAAREAYRDAREQAAIAEAVARGQTGGTIILPDTPMPGDPDFVWPPEGGVPIGMEGDPPWAKFGARGAAG